jgi:hypothetical protein
MLYFLIVVNFLISVWNAYVTGLAWEDSKAAGWWAQLVLWSGGGMAACGFTYCYAAIAALTADYFHWLPHAYAIGILELAYIAIIVPILGAGLVITVDSIVQAWKTKRISEIGVAAYNTYAQASNTWNALSGLGEVLGDVGALFGGKSGSKGGSKSGSSSGDDDASGTALLAVIVIAIAALFSGVLTTLFIASKGAQQRYLGSNQRSS